MLFNLSEQLTIGNQFLAELRDANVQQDRLRFRRNMERIGELLAYELSKKLVYEEKEIETPLGVANIPVPNQRLVLATILRAGLPLHQGLLNCFDKADNAFVSAYRRNHKDGSFEIEIEYISCPDLDGCVLIVSDPMLATGASMDLATRELLNHGEPQAIHFVTAIASTQGLEHVERVFPDAYIWVGAVDEELTAKSYIVPGLGDAGDLGFGPKLQD